MDNTSKLIKLILTDKVDLAFKMLDSCTNINLHTVGCELYNYMSSTTIDTHMKQLTFPKMRLSSMLDFNDLSHKYEVKTPTYSYSRYDTEPNFLSINSEIFFDINYYLVNRTPLTDSCFTAFHHNLLSTLPTTNDVILKLTLIMVDDITDKMFNSHDKIIDITLTSTDGNDIQSVYTVLEHDCVKLDIYKNGVYINDQRLVHDSNQLYIEQLVRINVEYLMAKSPISNYNLGAWRM